MIHPSIGPRALARSLLLAYRQWVGLPKLLSLPRPKGPVRSHSLNAETFQSPKTQSVGFPSSVPRTLVQDGTRNQSSGVDTEMPDKDPIKIAQESPVPTPPRFLLVDDNYINLKVLSAYMGKLGQRYETAVNGKEAVDAHESNAGEFAGIFMDISMPVMDGLEATRRIRAYERKKGLGTVPIVALTGLASHSVQQEARESGVDVFLTKPVTMKALDEALRSIRTRPGGGEDTTPTP